MPKAIISEKQYRDHPSISRSELWKMNETPEKFKYYLEHKPPETESLVFGQAAHKLLLQPESFDEEFVVKPKIDGRTKEGKAALADFLPSVNGRTIINQEDFCIISKMVDAAKSNPIVRQLLSGEREVSYFWTDKDTGVECKARLDCTVDLDGDLFVVDYKSTADASTEAFARSVLKYGYDFQGAMYCEAVEQVTGIKPAGFILIAQEKAEPYSLNIMILTDELLLHGYDTFRRFIGTFALCKQTDNWWGYLGRDCAINELSLPKWLKNE